MVSTLSRCVFRSICTQVYRCTRSLSRTFFDFLSGCGILLYMGTSTNTTPRPLSPRERAILRAYFASGSRATVAAKALGICRHYLWEVRQRPPAQPFLDAMEEATTQAVVQARAAQLLAPMLRP